MATSAPLTADGVDKPDGGDAAVRLSGTFWETASSSDVDAGDVEAVVDTPPPIVGAPEASTLPPYRRPPIPYGALVWTVYGAFTLLAIVDRFTTNVWPRQLFRVGAGTAGSDFTAGIKPGPWSVALYDILARTSGRFSICALNLLFATMMHTSMAAAAESWIGRRVIDFRGAAAANAALHKWNGIGLAVLTLLHVWTVLAPALFHGFAVRVVLGVWEWPASERGPAGFKDVDPVARLVMLQGDDVWRLVQMTLLLGVALPLSVRWLARRWHVGIHLHVFIAVAYFIDIVRRHTHPHSWVLNTPFFVAWIADLAVGLAWRFGVPTVSYRRLSDAYAVLTWTAPARAPAGCVGPTVYLRLPGASLWERAHPFTAFMNRGGLSPAVAGGGRPWTAGLVVRVYHRARVPALGRTERVSHTHRIAAVAAEAAGAAAVFGPPAAAGAARAAWSALVLQAWGPTHGEATAAIAAALSRGGGDVVLVASGSAVSYLLDAAQVVGPAPAAASVRLLYTVRDEALFRWAVAAFRDVAAAGGGCAAAVTVAYTGPGGQATVDAVAAAGEAARGGADVASGGATPVTTVAVVRRPASLTTTPTATTDSAETSGTDGATAEPAALAAAAKAAAAAAGGGGLALQAGRLALADALPAGATVFFQGSGGLRAAVAAAARRRRARLVAGGTFDGEGSGAAGGDGDGAAAGAV